MRIYYAAESLKTEILTDFKHKILSYFTRAAISSAGNTTPEENSNLSQSYQTI